MRIAQTGYYVISNNARNKYLNHKTNELEPIDDLDTLIARSHEFLLFTKDGLELVLDRLRDIPRLNHLIQNGVLIERMTLNAEFTIISGVKE